MTHLPTELSLVFKEHFFFPQKHLFGSVATVQDKQPHVRMMRIYDITQEGHLILVTHTASNKWAEFVDCPNVSINMVSESKLQQVIVCGSLQLDTAKSAFDQTKHYWEMVRPDVKKIYDPKYRTGACFTKQDALQIPEQAPDTFGIACVMPTFWELLQLDSEYVNSLRYQFHLKDKQWQKQRIHVG